MPCRALDLVPSTFKAVVRTSTPTYLPSVMDDSVFWHPSLDAQLQKCCDIPLSLDGNVENVQAVDLKDCVYVGGLRGTVQDECRLFIYSLSADTWNMLDTEVSHYSLALYESKITLIGGRVYTSTKYNSRSWNKTDKVWVLSDQYELHDIIIPVMKVKRESACTIGCGKHLVVAGGDEGEAKTVEVYNSGSKMWSYASPKYLPQSLDINVRSSVLHPDGNWYVQVKGKSNNKVDGTVFCASLDSLIASCTSQPMAESSLWKEHSKPPNTLSNLALHRNHLILIGNPNERSYEFSFYIYSPSAERWLEVADVPSETILPHRYRPYMPKSFDSAYITTISNNQFLLMGEIVNRRYVKESRDTMLHTSFQGKFIVVSMNV